MALFKSEANLLYFLIICFTINIVYAAPPVYPAYMHHDFTKCLHQISIAFKSDSCTECFSYALRHYKKGEHISVDDNLIPGTSGQSQNVASTSGQTHNIANTSNQSFVGQTNVEQDDTSLEDLSDFIGTFEGLEDFIRNDNQRNVRNFDEQAAHQADGKEDLSNQSFVGQMYDGKDDINLEDLSKYVDSFEGLQDFIKNDPQNSLQHFYAQSSGYEEQHQYTPNEHQYHPLNFAMAYYKELEKLVQGNNVLPPVKYCDIHYPYDRDCYLAMKIFGKRDLKSSKTAVGIALTDFKLDDCDNLYVYNYMEYMITNIRIISPTKSPRSFCLEIFKNYEWYLILKSSNV